MARFVCDLKTILSLVCWTNERGRKIENVADHHNVDEAMFLSFPESITTRSTTDQKAHTLKS